LFFYGVLACFTGFIGTIANGGAGGTEVPQALLYKKKNVILSLSKDKYFLFSTIEKSSTSSDW
jgi:hypothetical protein